jgi:hypothetical protein
MYVTTKTTKRLITGGDVIMSKKISLRELVLLLFVAAGIVLLVGSTLFIKVFLNSG